MDVWYKQLGYFENPFVLSPFKDKTPIIGQEKQLNDTLYYLQSGSIVFIEGTKGSGKTKFLRELMKSFQGKVIYVNAAKLKKTLNIEDLLRGKNGLAGKLFGSKPKDMILFLDNIEELSLVNLERLKYYFDQSFLQSVVCTGTAFKKVAFPESLAQRIGKRVLKLDHMTEAQAIKLALARLDEEGETVDPIITEDQIKTIFKAVKKNPKNFLIQLHRVFEEMHFADATTVEDKHLKVLEEKLDKDDKEELNHVLNADVATNEDRMMEADGNKIMKVGEYYRCPEHEMFCGNCGAIVIENDIACPECNASFEEAEVKEETKGEVNA